MSWNIGRFLKSIFSNKEDFQRSRRNLGGARRRTGDPREAYKNFVFERIQDFPEKTNPEVLSWSRDQVEIARREWACFLIFAIQHAIRRADLPKNSGAWNLIKQIETECVLGKTPDIFAIGSELDLSHRPPLVRL